MTVLYVIIVLENSVAFDPTQIPRIAGLKMTPRNISVQNIAYDVAWFCYWMAKKT